jgi:hypothetical protein
MSLSPAWSRKSFEKLPDKLRVVGGVPEVEAPDIEFVPPEKSIALKIISHHNFLHLQFHFGPGNWNMSSRKMGHLHRLMANLVVSRLASQNVSV